MRVPANLGVGGPSPHMHVLSLPAEDQLPPGFPSIDMGPQLKVVEKARTATMLCAAGGNPDPEISWFKDFLPVDPSTSNGRIKQLRSGEQRAAPSGGGGPHPAQPSRLGLGAWELPESQPGGDPPGLSRGHPVGAPDLALGPPGLGGEPGCEGWSSVVPAPSGTVRLQTAGRLCPWRHACRAQPGAGLCKVVLWVFILHLPCSPA